MRPIAASALLALLLAGGCAHIQLRSNAVDQAGTVADIYQQQVLDNLAKFVRDPHALPHFAVVTGGLNDVTDTGSGGFLLNWNFTRFTGASIDGGGTRGMSQNWTLVPINDPRKLELMRCAYQQAVAAMRICECPDCRKRFSRFYTGSSDQLSPPPGSIESDGRITADCLGSCWFHVGCKRCCLEARRYNPCCPSGSHCGCYVWVKPGVGTDELAKLTIAILDFALHNPPIKRPKEVVAYLDADGGLSTSSDASYRVTTTLPFDTSVRAVLTPDEQLVAQSRAALNRGRRMLHDARQLEQLPELLPPPKSLDGDDLPQRLQSLSTMMNSLGEEMNKKLPSLHDNAPVFAPQSVETFDPGPSFAPTPIDQLFQQQLRRVSPFRP